MSEYPKYCEKENTLEVSVCKKVVEARNLLIDAYFETGHNNRDTHTIRGLISDLLLPITANSYKGYGELMYPKDIPYIEKRIILEE